MEEKKMQLELTLTNRNSTYFAKATYNGETVTVKAGAKIFPVFSSCIRGGKTAKKFRESAEYINTEYTLLKDCSFKSPSTAAQFVTGRSVNGYNAWKIDEKKTLGDYLKERGLR